MQMPTTFTADILDLESSIGLDDRPHPLRVGSLVYPPVGFFPFAGTGNGDYHGFYWPIGREESEPMIGYSSHDAWALIPEYGNLTTAGCCQLATDEERTLTREFAAAFEVMQLPQPSIGISERIAHDNHKLFLTLDPDSPFRNCAVADQFIGENDLEAAEIHYRRAIELLPEYGAAHFGLGYLLRRTQRQTDASIHLRKSLLSPLAFWGGSFWAEHFLPGTFRNDWARKALLWLQQNKKPAESLHYDPFMRNIQQITLETGVAQNRDLELAVAMVNDYLELGQFLEAVSLWITIGDRAALETTSFRERYKFTSRSYGLRLAELLRLAGLERRATLVESMVAALEKPDGLYL